MPKCCICDREYESGRELTCSNECHEELGKRLIARFGEFKKVVRQSTGIAYKVPTRDIIEKGIREQDLDRYPVWEEEETAFVTDDRWMKEEGSRLDPTDRQILREASQNGRLRVRVINMQEMLEIMKKTEPEKFRDFQKTMERQAGKRLTFDDLVELGRKADERMSEFTDVVACMTLGQATQIRHWRTNGHMTWRSVARAAYLEGWFGRKWEPPSNQLMGMALVEKAAHLFGENFREEPWN